MWHQDRLPPVCGDSQRAPRNMPGRAGAAGKGRAIQAHLGGEVKWGVHQPLKAHCLHPAAIGDGEGRSVGCPDVTVPELDVIRSRSCYE